MVDIREVGGELIISVLGSHIQSSLKLAVVNDEIVVIIDTSENSDRMSVTNAAEYVVQGLADFLPILPEEIVYRDTDGEWAKLVHDNGIFTGYAPIKQSLVVSDLSVSEVIEIVSSHRLQH